MPHLISNRERVYKLTEGREDLRKQFRWESLNAVLYKIGGLTFVVGSFFFYPALSAYLNVGAFTFFVGSILYLIVTTHDLLEVSNHLRREPEASRNERLELVAAFAYQTGTVLFTVGSLLFLSWFDQIFWGAWCFIVGSFQFVVGAAVNVLQVPEKGPKSSLQLVNLTAVTFVTGSVLFLVASVPYLWPVSSGGLEDTLDAFLASQYLVGSILFLAGGITNYFRAYIFMRRQIAARKHGKPGKGGGQVPAPAGS